MPMSKAATETPHSRASAWAAESEPFCSMKTQGMWWVWMSWVSSLISRADASDPSSSSTDAKIVSPKASAK